MSNHLHLVDRHFHERPGQAARDTLKNRILAKSGTPILRLCTIESGIKEKIADFVAPWASTALGIGLLSLSGAGSPAQG